jgi:hypothetical protein
MDHAEVIELIELAAAEPEGLARLTAGDTPEAAAVAGHLAGCDACAAELARTARAATVAREAIRELPDPALRDRALAFVRAVGRDRSASAAPTAARALAAQPSADGAPPSMATTGTASLDPGRGAGDASDLRAGGRRSRRGWWYAAAAAAVLVAGLAGFAAGGAVRAPGSAGDGAAAMAAARTTMHIARQPDVVTVSLAAADGSQAAGTVMYSAASGELAMTASGLSPAPDGAIYSCWVEQGGQRRRIGWLYVDGANGSWAGPLDGLDAIHSGATFGVSLVTTGADAGTPVLTGGG